MKYYTMLKGFLRSYLFVFMLPFVCFGQQKNNSLDSLINLQYEELAKILNDTKTDTNIYKNYADAYLKKARKDTSKQQLLWAYEYQRLHAYLTNSDTQINYLDSIIDYSKNLKIKNYPEMGYYIKALILYDKKDFKGSLDNYLEAYNLAKKKKSHQLIYGTTHGIAVIKSRIGNYKEALNITLNCKKYLETETKSKRNSENYLITLSLLTHLYRKTNKIDSSSIINQLGIKKSLKKSLNEYYSYFILSEGINLYKRNNYKQSIDSLRKSLILLKEINDKPNIAFANFYIGKNYLKVGNKEKSISFFEQVDTIFQNTNYLNPDLRENYEILIDHFKSQNNKDKQLVYINRLLKLDSILFNDYKYLVNNLNKRYNSPELLESKEKLVHSINKKNKTLSGSVLIIGAISFIITLFLIYNYRKKRYYRKRFNELINTSSNVTKSNPSKTSNKKERDLDIPEKVSTQILSGLERFESKKGYLQQNITIGSLAKDLKTNTKYLSKIINLYHKKSFVNYINDARIDFIVNELKDNEKIRKFTIKAISEHSGFKNAQSFSQAFLKRTGIYPSYFIKNVSN
ncbi:helix-turn-helix domain-containing protein [Aquimarina celericrescens]|uniref:Helix-turn-helix domain-containing protein n=1 Tax=Aquimarina celericrescens TaxID=1964542 RepID=A0ABW5AVB6_9FLAO|nr:helix-turn-helix domain-containing protein [Aquimarina celericrescens]